ncbi:hypothetical protein EBX93_15425, partial [bacterium]|nr:hypothetical protein [bacterium]
MNRETKAGLVVTASFVGLLSAVIIKKYMDPSVKPGDKASETAVASLDPKEKTNTQGIVPVVTPASMDLVP